MSRPDLVFMTPLNQHQVMAELAERRARCEHNWDEKGTCKACLITKRELAQALAEIERTRSE